MAYITYLYHTNHRSIQSHKYMYMIQLSFHKWLHFDSHVTHLCIH